MVVDVENKNPVLKIGGNNIYRADSNIRHDNGYAIANSIKFGLSPQKSNGTINHFNYLSMRISGKGSIGIELSSEDNARLMNPPIFVLENKPGIEMGERLIMCLRKWLFVCYEQYQYPF